MTIVFIRHAKTQGNLERRYIGKTDQPLCGEGKQVLLKNIRDGRYPRCDAVYTSPMKRCLETARAVYPDITAVVVEDLCECNFGDFEGKTYEQLKDNPKYRLFLESGGAGEIPNGESGGQFKARCLRAFQELLEDMQERKVSASAVVCHGGTIMAILEHFGGQGRTFYDYQAENCGGYCGTYDIETGKFLALKRL